MNSVIKLFEKGPAGNIAACFLLFVITLAAELLVFNHHFFFGRVSGSGYEQRAFEIPVSKEHGARVVVMSSENNELTLNSVNSRLANIMLTTTLNDERVITFTFQAREQNGQFITLGATRVNPGRQDQRTALIHLNHADSEKTFSAVRITASSPNPFIIGITNIDFNAPEKLHFSWIRVLVLFMAASALFFIRRYKVYLIIFDESRRAHRAMNYVVIACAACICTLFFMATSPYNTRAWAFDFNGEGLYPFNNEERTMLYPLPQTVEENNLAGPYEQLLSSLLKGKVSINVFVDPKLATLENPWDPSARDAAGTRYTWDRPYYNGQYFVYFGPAPLIMVYAPCYALTGMIPSPALSVYLLAMMAVLSVLWAYRVLVRTLVPYPNLLMYMLVQAAALSGTLLWLIQIGLSFYYLPYLAAMTWMSLYVGSLYSLFRPVLSPDEHRPRSQLQTRALLLLAGISVPMLVWSRPLALAALLALSIPAIILLVRENYSLRKDQSATDLSQPRINYTAALKDAMFALVPVMVGAAVIMYYNYVRFDSVTEFGQTYQFTGDDVKSKGLFFGWAHLRSAVYYFLFEPLDYIREFPFVFANIDHYYDHGNLVMDFDRVSLFSIPVFWSLFLMMRSRRAMLECSIRHIRIYKHLNDTPGFDIQLKVMEKRMSMLKTTAFLTAFAIVFLVYLSYYNAAVLSRYLCEMATAGSYLAVVLVLLNTGFMSSGTATVPHVESSCSKSAVAGSLPQALAGTSWSCSLIYGLTVFLLLKSLLIGLLLPFTSTYELLLDLGTAFNEMNPGLMLDMYRVFTPFGQ
ncbi:hypothetical protein [Anaerobiospirillum sp. NML120449]|uniref:hypothetical protein n=1 Tax=Anaerobiospirillum sp. NML120449 TaxID=2932817 RepID=UPI001FF444C6|nr:hypothetical protein [Anaerobiospirillum sp. NML120449]MCK0525565.1 hypothetical protein [Anaerobiospirillum sp. NML120449]